MEDKIKVISSEYCYSDSLNLKIDTKKGVTYIDNKVVFRVKNAFFTLNNHPVLYDGSENPIATMYRKNFTSHDRCQVFKGKSKDPNELLFQVKRSPSLNQREVVDLDVFLSNNKHETRLCDFKVNIIRNKKSCEIYAAQSSTAIAQMKINNGMFEVLVLPNIDHAFIVALLMIVDRFKYFDYHDFSLSAAGERFETVLDALSDGITNLN